jgi:hypothetical protein
MTFTKLSIHTYHMLAKNDYMHYIVDVTQFSFLLKPVSHVCVPWKVYKRRVDILYTKAETRNVTFEANHISYINLYIVLSVHSPHTYR